MSGLIGRIPKLALAGVTLLIGAAIAVGAVAVFDGGASTTPTAGPDRAALEQFEQCLSEHGVTPPQPGSGAPSARGTPSQKLQQALQDCRQYAPAGPTSGAPPLGGPPSGAPGGIPVPTPGS